MLWGGSFFFVGVAIRELPPLTVVLLRVTLAALLLLPLLWVYRIRFPRGFSGWRPFFAIAALNNVLPFSLIVTGQTFVSEWAGLDPERDHAAVHGAGDGRRR